MVNKCFERCRSANGQSIKATHPAKMFGEGNEIWYVLINLVIFKFHVAITLFVKYCVDDSSSRLEFLEVYFGLQSIS